MEFFKNESRPAKQAPEEWFTGTVWMDPIITAPEPARVNAVKVHFTPGARTAWHTHPLGQTLYVIEGAGLFGLRGEKPQAMRVGDTFWIPPHEEHWHGASPDTGMTHIAIQETLDGSAADWLEHVTEDEYLPAW